MLRTIRLIALIVPVAVSAVSANAQVYTRKQLTEDFEILRSALHQGQSGVYRHTSEKDLNDRGRRLTSSLKDGMTDVEFYRALAPYVAAIKDAHTLLEPSRTWEDDLELTASFFPFELRFVNSRPYIIRDYTSEGIAEPGSELLSINGVSIDDVVGGMMEAIPADGAITTSKMHALQDPVTFGRLYSLLYGEKAQFAVRYLSRETGEPVQIDVAPCAQYDFETLFKSRYPYDAATKDQQALNPLQLEIDGAVAILTIRTMDVRAHALAGVAYENFLLNAFRDIRRRGPATLIIDIRGVGSGDIEDGKILYSYLSKGPFNYYRFAEATTARPGFLGYSHIAPGDFPRGRFKKNARNTYDEFRNPNLGLQQPGDPVFIGTVYIMVDGGTRSVMAEFASIAHATKRAIFVGEETGGAFYGGSAGITPILTLPNTKLRVHVPLVKHTLAVSGELPGRGVIPAYPVRRTIDDIMTNDDVAMELTRSLVASGFPLLQPPRPMELAFNARDNVRIFGNVWASTLSKSAPIIFLFHQAGGDARGEYEAIVPILVERGYIAFAIDQRSGGNQFGQTNRTVEKIGATVKYSYCDAYRDLEAAIRRADESGFTGKRILWGSSYSASLVIRLAVEHPENVVGVLAFSPASGDAMGNCQPDAYSARLKIPLLVMRPESEMEHGEVARQLEMFEAQGHETYVAEHGVHGSSMMNPQRVGASVALNWMTVMTFLRDVTRDPAVR